MTVKAVEMVRQIRDKQYEETKNLTVEEQIQYIRNKAKKLRRNLAAKKSHKSKQVPSINE